MARIALTIGLLALALNLGLPVAQAAGNGPVFDDSGYHPSILPPGSLEYQYALQRQHAPASQAADPAQLSAALQACQLISPLSPLQRDKCEIKAHQTASHPLPHDGKLN